MTDNLWPDELKILVVDDEQVTLNLIRLSLEPAGFRIIRTTRPEEGVDLALKEQPDLLLLDIMMPGLDGFELLRRVRNNTHLQKIPVVFISARFGTTDQLRMFQLTHDLSQVDAFIGKPFDPAMLLKTVKRVLVQNKEFLLAKRDGREKPSRTRQSTYL